MSQAPGLLGKSRLDFRPECFTQFCAQPEIVAKIVDQRLPLRGVDMRPLHNQVFPNMRLDNAHFDRSSTAQLGQSTLAVKHVNTTNFCL